MTWVEREGKQFLLLERRDANQSGRSAMPEPIAELEIPALQPDQTLAYGSDVFGCQGMARTEFSSIIAIVTRSHGCIDSMVARAWLADLEARRITEIPPAGIKCRSIWWVEGCP